MKLPTIFRRRRPAAKSLSALPGGAGNGWISLARWGNEYSTGQWQRAVRISDDEILRHHATFACVSQIATDVAKMRMRLMALGGASGATYWQESPNPAYSPVLSTPNFFQTSSQFLESWLWSKLGHGNTYVLKQRDNRGVVSSLWVLDPWRVRPLIANDDSGAVFYQLFPDRLVPGMALEGNATVTVPAREIIHDRYNTIRHPLVGSSALFAAMAAAAGGLSMVESSARFFKNGAAPRGMLIAPGQIDPDTAKRLEDKWDEEYSGEGTGKIAVLGSGLKFEPMQLSMVDAQIVDQMKWSATQICSVFHVPPWKIGLDTWPRGVINVESLQVDYLASCLQSYVDAIESCLTAGLGLSSNLRVELDEFQPVANGHAVSGRIPRRPCSKRDHGSERSASAHWPWPGSRRRESVGATAKFHAGRARFSGSCLAKREQRAGAATKSGRSSRRAAGGKASAYRRHEV